MDLQHELRADPRWPPSPPPLGGAEHDDGGLGAWWMRFGALAWITLLAWLALGVPGAIGHAAFLFALLSAATGLAWSAAALRDGAGTVTLAVRLGAVAAGFAAWFYVAVIVYWAGQMPGMLDRGPWRAGWPW